MINTYNIKKMYIYVKYMYIFKNYISSPFLFFLLIKILDIFVGYCKCLRLLQFIKYRQREQIIRQERR